MENSNRIIKFRAWDKQKKKMYYPKFETNIQIDDGYVGFTNGRIDNGSFILDYNAEIMQFTGLHDKNGKEIYEGDVIEGTWNDKKVKGVVVFDEGMFGIEDVIGGDAYSLNRLNAEVIGNIYENPELLESQNTPHTDTSGKGKHE